jgi:predicted ribosomally synthesized peptide with nif11-like leader
MANLEQFLQQVQQDDALRTRLAAATNPEDAVKLALEMGAEKGYTFTEAEVREAIQNRQAPKLSDRELDQVAGGDNPYQSMSFVIRCC